MPTQVISSLCSESAKQCEEGAGVIDPLKKKSVKPCVGVRFHTLKSFVVPTMFVFSLSSKNTYAGSVSMCLCRMSQNKMVTVLLPSYLLFKKENF